MIKHYEIISKMTNVFDYSEFIHSCKKENIPQLTWTEYASKVNMLQYAMHMNPTMEPLEAYILEVKNNNNTVGIPKYVYIPTKEQVIQTQQTSTCCGGGKVR